MPLYLDFEKPIAELEGKVRELRHLHDSGGADVADELARLESKTGDMLRSVYAKLTPWQKTLVARHQDRPHLADFTGGLLEDYVPLAGDRNFAEDTSIGGGVGRFRGQSVVIIGHEKGRGTEGRLKHNFGMARPEGYRKAVRLMRLADRFHLPILTFIDTPGAYPGIDAEARGQSEAIARAIDCCLDVRVPFIAAIVGEGGSGGAVALASANRVLMFEHAVYSVISPEGCAAILWNSPEKTQEAADALKLTAADLLKLKVIDEVVPEPLGGAHRDVAGAVQALGESLDRQLQGLMGVDPGVLREGRRRKFLDMGRVGL